MKKVELTVHEFMAVMGHIDEQLGDKELPTGDTSIYTAWYTQWKALDERLEKLAPLERADMLFDGKVAINAITEPQLQQLISVVEYQIDMHKKLIKDNDEDADPEDLEIWEKRLNELQTLLNSTNWIS